MRTEFLRLSIQRDGVWQYLPRMVHSIVTVNPDSSTLSSPIERSRTLRSVAAKLVARGADHVAAGLAAGMLAGRKLGAAANKVFRLPPWRGGMAEPGTRMRGVRPLPPASALRPTIRNKLGAENAASDVAAKLVVSGVTVSAAAKDLLIDKTLANWSQGVDDPESDYRVRHNFKRSWSDWVSHSHGYDIYTHSQQLHFNVTYAARLLSAAKPDRVNSLLALTGTSVAGVVKRDFRSEAIDAEARVQGWGVVQKMAAIDSAYGTKLMQYKSRAPGSILISLA